MLRCTKPSWAARMRRETKWVWSRGILGHGGGGWERSGLFTLPLITAPPFPHRMCSVQSASHWLR